MSPPWARQRERWRASSTSPTATRAGSPSSCSPPPASTPRRCASWPAAMRTTTAAKRGAPGWRPTRSGRRSAGRPITTRPATRGRASAAPASASCLLTDLVGLLDRVLAGALAGRAGGLLGTRVLGDERLGVLARLVVRALVLRGLHEVGARTVELAADAVVERELAAAHGV